MRDMLGREIRVGDWVAYATAPNHRPVTKVGVIERIEDEAVGIRATHAGGRRSWNTATGKQLSWPSTENIVKIDPPEAW